MGITHSHFPLLRKKHLKHLEISQNGKAIGEYTSSEAQILWYLYILAFNICILIHQEQRLSYILLKQKAVFQFIL